MLKELFDLSDPQTADALRYDIRWKVACGRSLDQMSFDPSTLVYWRKRIAASDRPDRVFNAVAELIAATGVLRGRRKRCVDSTVFDDAVATQDTVTQLVAAVRKVARVVPGAAAVIAQVCTLDYGKAGKPDIDWDDPQAKQDLVWDLVNDALRLLEVLAGLDAPERDAAAADALGLLALVAGQDVRAGGRIGRDGRAVADRPESRAGPGDQHRGPGGPAHPQEQVPAPGRVPRARGRRAGDRADHRLRDDHGRRGRQHRCGQRGEDGLPRPVPRRRG